MIHNLMEIKLITFVFMNVDLENLVITQQIYVFNNVLLLQIIMEILIQEDAPCFVLKADMLRMIPDYAKKNALLESMQIIWQDAVLLYVLQVKELSEMIFLMIALEFVLMGFGLKIQLKNVYLNAQF